MHYIDSSSMLQKLLAAIITEEWAREAEASSEQPLIERCALAQDLSAKTLAFLQEQPPLSYHEMAFTLARLHSECYSLLHGFAQDCKVPAASIPVLGTEIDVTGQNPNCFTIDTAQSVVSSMFDQLRESLGRTKKRELALLVDKRAQVAANVERYTAAKTQHDIRVSAAFAATFVALKGMPEKVSPVVKGIMSGIKVRSSFVCAEKLATHPRHACRAKRTSISRRDPPWRWRRLLTSVQPTISRNRLIRLSRTSAHSCARIQNAHLPLPILGNRRPGSCLSESLRHRRPPRLTANRRANRRHRMETAAIRCLAGAPALRSLNCPRGSVRGYWTLSQACGTQWREVSSPRAPQVRPSLFHRWIAQL